MITNTDPNRRNFLKKTSGLVAGLGVGMHAIAHPGSQISKNSLPAQKYAVPDKLPNNPLVLFDNFHVGSRREYSWKAKFAAAQNAGFDGFELVTLDPQSDGWKEVVDLMPATHFTVWGLHWTTNAVVDGNAGKLESDIEKIQEVVAACALTPIEYMSLSLSGSGELRGPAIHESGSARAQDRHWERAYKIIAAFDLACQKHGVRGSLYPHTHWLCDTPQSQVRILEGANTQTIGPAFCSHHWYANKASDELDEVLKYPLMQRLNYLVLTNGRFSGNDFPAVRFDEGEIDMAWLLAKMYDFGYEGPISTQGWGIGGDPYVTSKCFVDTMKALRKRFETQPELWPLR